MNKNKKLKYSIENIQEGLTISGLDCDLSKLTAGFSEYFCDEAWMHLKLHPSFNKENYDKALSMAIYMSDHDSVPWGLDDSEEAKDLISAYVFVVLDRIAKDALGGKNGWDTIHYINELWGCMHRIDPSFKSLRATAKKGIATKLANDPKQRDKKFVHECWIKWQEKPLSYPSQAEFARDMLEKCEHLKSQKKT